MEYLKYHTTYAQNLNSILSDEQLMMDVKTFVLMLKKAKRHNNTIYVCGNGGHASTSNHFATDLCALGANAISLTANPSEVTRIANDFGYEQVFKKQLENILAEDDIVVGISASGNSQNVVNALEYATQQRAHSVALVGFETGGRAKEVASHSVHAVRGEVGPLGKLYEYGLAEDAHMTICHIVSNYLIHG